MQESAASKKRAAKEPAGEASEKQPSKRSKAGEAEPPATATQPSNGPSAEAAAGALAVAASHPETAEGKHRAHPAPNNTLTL